MRSKCFFCWKSQWQQVIHILSSENKTQKVQTFIVRVSKEVFIFLHRAAGKALVEWVFASGLVSCRLRLHLPHVVVVETLQVFGSVLQTDQPLPPQPGNTERIMTSPSSLQVLRSQPRMDRSRGDGTVPASLFYFVLIPEHHMMLFSPCLTITYTQTCTVQLCCRSEVTLGDWRHVAFLLVL